MRGLASDPRCPKSLFFVRFHTASHEGGGRGDGLCLMEGWMVGKQQPCSSHFPPALPSLTIVLHIAGLLPGCVLADAKDLHSYQWIHNGLLLGLVHFGELLPTDYLQPELWNLTSSCSAQPLSSSHTLAGETQDLAL